MPKAYAQRWTERERGWGGRPDGFTLYLTKDQYHAHIMGDARVKREAKEVPDEYTTTCGTLQEVEVSDQLLEELVRRVGTGEGHMWFGTDATFEELKTFVPRTRKLKPEEPMKNILPTAAQAAAAYQEVLRKQREAEEQKRRNEQFQREQHEARLREKGAMEAERLLPFLSRYIQIEMGTKQEWDLRECLDAARKGHKGNPEYVVADWVYAHWSEVPDQYYSGVGHRDRTFTPATPDSKTTYNGFVAALVKVLEGHGYSVCDLPRADGRIITWKVPTPPVCSP